MRAGFVWGNWSKCVQRRVATRRKGQIASTCFSLAYPRGRGNTANISSTGLLLATAAAVTGARIQHRKIQRHDRRPRSERAPTVAPDRYVGPRTRCKSAGSCLLPSGHHGMYPARGARSASEILRSIVQCPCGFQRDPRSRGRRGTDRTCFSPSESGLAE
jgi:hypothetical protein